MFGAARSSISLGARRLLATPARQTLARQQLHQPLIRPFAVLSRPNWQQFHDVEKTEGTRAFAQTVTQVPVVSAVEQKAVDTAAVQRESVVEATVDTMRSKSMVFEIGIS